jgi:hypothetical protein
MTLGIEMTARLTCFVLLGVAIMNAGHNVTVSGGNYVGGNVTNSQVNTTRVGPSDEEPK